MKVLVTGAAGFIGFHLVGALLDKEYSVVGIDDINDYYDVNLKYDRLNESGIASNLILDNKLVQTKSNRAYKFNKMNITNLKELGLLFSAQQFDIVIHLAAQPGVRYSLENPHAYVQSNVVGFMNILECCRRNQVKHLVYASSSSVYGMNNKIPFDENDRVDHPVSLYAATKKSNELMAHTYSHLYKLPTTGLRFFTVYGPWGRPDMAPMLFADAMAKGNAIKVFNEGDMQRDFTYVDDVVEGVIRAARFVPGEDETEPYYRLLNIGNSKPVHLMDFIKEMQHAMEKEVKLDMYPMQAGDVPVTYASTAKLAAITGYKPSTTLHEGVSNFVRWYKEYTMGQNIYKS